MTYDDVTSKERKLSGALALVMHAMFLGLLVFGFSWQKQHIESTMIVELWSSLPPLPQPKPEPSPPEPPKPLPKPPPEPPKPVPKVEPKPVIDPDIALRKEKLEKERKQKEAQEAQRKKELEAKKLAEKKAREAAALKAKQAKEAEAKAQAKAAREKEDALQKLAQAQQAAQDKVMNDYVHGIRERIKRYVVVPPNMQGNPEAQFDVVQIPGGEVLNVALKRSSGIAAYDQAVERAIRKASPLPPPPPGVAFSEVRELNLKFRPKE